MDFICYCFGEATFRTNRIIHHFSVSLAYYDREGGRGTKVLQIVITEIGKHSKISAFKKNVFDEITL